MTSKPPYRVPSMAEIKSGKWNGFDAASTFSGCGGSSLGYRMAGFRLLWANEFVPAARETYLANAAPYTVVDGSDVRALKVADVLTAMNKKPGELDLFDGSPPCFAAGTSVVAERRVIAIEDVVVGDKVLTGKGRWRRVTDVMTRRAATLIVDGRIEVTSDHPFLAREQRKKNGTRFTLGSERWVPATEVEGMFCAVPTAVRALTVPEIGGRPLALDNDFWWMVGRWIGDGWVRVFPGEDRPAKDRVPLSKTPRLCAHCGTEQARRRQRGNSLMFTAYCSEFCRLAFGRKARKRPRHSVLLCSSLREGDDLSKKLRRIRRLTWAASKQRATWRFSTSHKQLTLWLVEQFGRGAAKKTLPGWVFGMREDHRRSLFEGYLSADGHEVERGGTWKFSSVSRNLSVGMRVLATTLGYSTGALKMRKGGTHILGRRINGKGSWPISACANETRYTRVEGDHRWSKIRRATVAGGDDVDVFDLTVEEDHSFVADGFVVHNCASFSTAGKRSGGWGTVKKYSDVAQRTDDLFFEFARLLEGVRPRTFVAENVAGLVRGVAVGYFNDVLGLLRSLGYRVAARLLDAQWLGVPQQRSRIIFVGVREDLGFEPAYPEPQQFRYTVADACPWVKAVRTHSNRDVYYRAAGDAPAPTITSHDHKTGETSIHGGGFVESDVPLGAFDGVDIGRFAIGAEWDRLEEGEQSSRFFNLIRADRDKPSPTILASHGGGSIASVTHPTEKRKFSIPELRRLCSFPDDFKLLGTYEQNWERLGRAVPPLMMKAIAETVRDKILIPWRAAKEARER